MLEHGFSFEQWVVTPADRVVSGPYGATKLEPKVMDVFVELAAHAGEVVSRLDLIDRVWPGAVVGDEVLSRCIYQIRQALGENSHDVHYLETVPKHGYRLTAAVVDLADLAEAGTKSGYWQESSPFRGLHAFDVAHAPVFFGRARATQEALAALLQQASLDKTFLLLLGASGVGKSSLARAGILHNLTQSMVVEGIRHWRYDSFRPGDNRAGPCDALLDALVGVLGTDAPTRAAVQAALLPTDEPASDKIAVLLSACLAGDEKIAFVVDQLEEVFSGSHIRHEQRAAFFDSLEALASSGYCWIIATLRSDFYSQCSAYPSLMRLKKSGGQYDVRLLSPDEIRQTIRLPAKAAGLEFERCAETGQGLDDALYDIAAVEPRLLPLLEFTLQALYDERNADGVLTFEKYHALGGIEGSLARRADAVFNEIPQQQRDALPQVLARLVHIADGRVSKSSRSLSEFPGEESRSLISAFVDARLLNAELDKDGQARIGIVHEALLTHWPRVKKWIAENREMILVQERVSVARTRWEADQRRDDLLLPRGKSLDEAQALASAAGIELNSEERHFIDASARRAVRRHRWERTAVAGLAILTILAGGVAWLAGQQRNLAIEQSVIADREAQAAKETADFLIQIFDAADPLESTGGQPTARRILDHGVARLDEGLAGQSALRTKIRVSVAAAYRGLGLYADAETLLRQANEEAGNIDDFSDRDRLAIRFELADVIFQRGELGISEAMHDEVLAERMQLFGENDIDTAASLNILAHKLWRDGAAGDAKELFDRVLTIRRALLGNEDPRVVDVITSMGTLHFRQGLRRDAANYYREAAELAPAAYGERSVSTAIAISNLAAVEEDSLKRESLLQQSLSIRREVLGDQHHLVARAEDILAKFYADQGYADRADALYRQVIDRLVGESEVTLLLPSVRNNYGQFLQSQQRYDDALRIFRAARKNYENELGASHRHTGLVGKNLAYTYFLNGDHETAEQLLREILALRKPDDSSDKFVLADIERALAEVMLAGGDTEEAKRLARSAAEIYGEDTLRHRISLAATMAVLAHTQLTEGDSAAALASANRALELGEGDLVRNLAVYGSLAGLANAVSGNCETGLRILKAAYAEVPETIAAARHKDLIATRLNTAQRACVTTTDGLASPAET